jgi:hypothetical protein
MADARVSARVDTPVPRVAYDPPQKKFYDHPHDLELEMCDLEKRVVALLVATGEEKPGDERGERAELEEREKKRGVLVEQFKAKKNEFEEVQREEKKAGAATAPGRMGAYCDCDRSRLKNDMYGTGAAVNGNEDGGGLCPHGEHPEVCPFKDFAMNPCDVRGPVTFVYSDEGGDNVSSAVESVEVQDIEQGALGDCWFLSGLSCAMETMNAAMKERIIDVRFERYGIYGVRFFLGGVPTYVYVDSYIPCYMTHTYPVLCQLDNVLVRPIVSESVKAIGEWAGGEGGGETKEEYGEEEGTRGPEIIKIPFSHPLRQIIVTKKGSRRDRRQDIVKYRDLIKLAESLPVRSEGEEKETHADEQDFDLENGEGSFKRAVDAIHTLQNKSTKKDGDRERGMKDFDSTYGKGAAKAIIDGDGWRYHDKEGRMYEKDPEENMLLRHLLMIGDRLTLEWREITPRGWVGDLGKGKGKKKSVVRSSWQTKNSIRLEVASVAGHPKEQADTPSFPDYTDCEKWHCEDDVFQEYITCRYDMKAPPSALPSGGEAGARSAAAELATELAEERFEAMARMKKVLNAPEVYEFRIRMTQGCGKWFPAFAKSADRGEVWPMLIEKAFAKLHGSYTAIEGGQLSDALAYLMGGAPEEKHLVENEIDYKKEVWEKLIRLGRHHAKATRMDVDDAVLGPLDINDMGRGDPPTILKQIITQCGELEKEEKEEWEKEEREEKKNERGGKEAVRMQSLRELWNANESTLAWAHSRTAMRRQRELRIKRVWSKVDECNPGPLVECLRCYQNADVFGSVAHATACTFNDNSCVLLGVEWDFPAPPFTRTKGGSWKQTGVGEESAGGGGEMKAAERRLDLLVVRENGVVSRWPQNVVAVRQPKVPANGDENTQTVSGRDGSFKGSFVDAGFFLAAAPTSDKPMWYKNNIRKDVEHNTDGDTVEAGAEAGGAANTPSEKEQVGARTKEVWNWPSQIPDIVRDGRLKFGSVVTQDNVMLYLRVAPHPQWPGGSLEVGKGKAGEAGVEPGSSPLGHRPLRSHFMGHIHAKLDRDKGIVMSVPELSGKCEEPPLKYREDARVKEGTAVVVRWTQRQHIPDNKSYNDWEKNEWEVCPLERADSDRRSLSHLSPAAAAASPLGPSLVVTAARRQGDPVTIQNVYFLPENLALSLGPIGVGNVGLRVIRRSVGRTEHMGGGVGKTHERGFGAKGGSGTVVGFNERTEQAIVFWEKPQRAEESWKFWKFWEKSKRAKESWKCRKTRFHKLVSLAAAFHDSSSGEEDSSIMKEIQAAKEDSSIVNIGRNSIFDIEVAPAGLNDAVGSLGAGSAPGHDDTAGAKNNDGIVPGHAYSILRALDYRNDDTIDAHFGKFFAQGNKVKVKAGSLSAAVCPCCEAFIKAGVKKYRRGQITRVHDEEANDDGGTRSYDIVFDDDDTNKVHLMQAQDLKRSDAVMQVLCLRNPWGKGEFVGELSDAEMKWGRKHTECRSQWMKDAIEEEKDVAAKHRGCNVDDVVLEDADFAAPETASLRAACKLRNSLTDELKLILDDNTSDDTERDDGVFFMTFEDFQGKFSNVYSCVVDHGTSLANYCIRPTTNATPRYERVLTCKDGGRKPGWYNFPSVHARWTKKELGKGKGLPNFRHATAGGHFWNKNGEARRNPHFGIELHRTTSITVSLTQMVDEGDEKEEPLVREAGGDAKNGYSIELHGIRRGKLHSISLYLIKGWQRMSVAGKTVEPKCWEGATAGQVVASSGAYAQTRVATCAPTEPLPAGRYTIAACTAEPGDEADIFIQVLANRALLPNDVAREKEPHYFCPDNGWETGKESLPFNAGNAWVHELPL